MQVNYKEQLHLELCLIEDHEYKREELLSIVEAKIAILSIEEILKTFFKIPIPLVISDNGDSQL